METLELASVVILTLLAAGVFTFADGHRKKYLRNLGLGFIGLIPGLILGIFAPMPDEDFRLPATLYFASMTEAVFFYVYWTSKRGVNPVV
jgi:hypothetical protein